MFSLFLIARNLYLLSLVRLYVSIKGPQGGTTIKSYCIYIYIYVQTNYQRKFEMIPHTEDVLLSFTKIKILDIIKNFMDIFALKIISIIISNFFSKVTKYSLLLKEI